MTDVKRKHYVPLVLSKHFANSNGQVWVYDKQEKKWFCTNPINVAVEKDMYSQQMEQWLSEEVEGPVSPIFEKLSSRDADLNEGEMLLVARFIVTQMMRVSAVRDNVVEKYDAPGSPKLRDVFLGEIEKFRLIYGEEKIRRLEDLLNTDPQAFREEMDWQPDSFGKMLEAPMHDEDVLNEHASFLMRFAWRIIHPDKGRFILSDKPIEVWNFKVVGVDNLLTEFFFPVSPKCAIHIGRYGQGGVVNEVSTQDRLVKRFNTEIAANAHRFIYSTRKERWVEKIAHARTQLSRRPHIRFGGPLIQAQHDRPPCPNCGEEYTQAEWDSGEISHEVMEEDGKYTLNEGRYIAHSCSTRIN